MAEDAFTLDYRPASREPQWSVNIDGALVTLVFPGRPLWRQVTWATLSALSGGALTVFFLVFLIYALRHPAEPVRSGVVCAVLSLVCGWISLRSLRQLLRLLKFGREGHLVLMTSLPLATAVDPAVLRRSDVYVVAEVLHSPGRLLATGRRQSLLRLPVAQGTGLDLVWWGKWGDLNELVDELRELLRLNDA